MKKIVLITALIGGFTVAGFAQEQGKDYKKPRWVQKVDKTPEERAKQYTAVMDKHLNLTEKQEKKVYQMELEKARDMEKARAEKMQQRRKELEEFKAEREAYRKRFRQLLTAEQRSAYEKLEIDRQHRFENRKERMKRRFEEGHRDSMRGKRSGG